MSLDGPAAAMMGRTPEVAVDLPDVDDYTEGAWCPRCNRKLTTVATPGVPVELLVDDELVLALQDDDVDEVPAFGWRCERHRTDVVLPASYAIAPETYRPVDADFGGDEVTLAVPAPFLSNYDL